MIIEISVLIMALSVAALVIFLIQTLRKAQHSIETANETLREARDLIHSSKDDVEGLVGNVRDLIAQVNTQVGAVEPLMSSVRDVGTVVHEVTTAAREVSTSWMGSLKRKSQHAVAQVDRATAAKAAEPAPANNMKWLDWLDTGVKVARGVQNAMQAFKSTNRAAAPQVAATTETVVKETIKEQPVAQEQVTNLNRRLS